MTLTVIKNEKLLVTPYIKRSYAQANLNKNAKKWLNMYFFYSKTRSTSDFFFLAEKN